MKTLTEQIFDADMRGSNWLAKANAAAERGDHAKAEKFYAKGNYWLDRSNALVAKKYAESSVVAIKV